MRLRSDGTIRVTLPRRGSIPEAIRFVHRNIAWLEQQLVKQSAVPRSENRWEIGSEIYFRGEVVRIEQEAHEMIRFGPERLKVKNPDQLRAAIERHLRQLATQELTARVRELADHHAILVNRVTVRNQRTRWGSCSRRGTISLNWRLIQTPDRVRDYIVLHELAHRRHMDHSKRFWEEVERLCPDYKDAELWLKTHKGLIR